MATCDQHGSISNKLSWVLGILSVGSCVIVILFCTIQYTLHQVGENVDSIRTISVDVARIEEKRTGDMDRIYLQFESVKDLINSKHMVTNWHKDIGGDIVLMQPQD